MESVTNHKFILVTTDSDNNRQETTEYYARFNVLVNVSNQWMQGFACGTPNPHGILGTTGPGGGPPTSFSECPDPDICGEELFLPMWICSDCKLCDQYLTGEPAPCRWALYSSSRPISWPSSRSITYPYRSIDFIEVVMEDSIYSSFAEFIVLNVLLGGVIVVFCLGMMGAMLFQALK